MKAAPVVENAKAAVEAAVEEAGPVVDEVTKKIEAAVEEAKPVVEKKAKETKTKAKATGKKVAAATAKKAKTTQKKVAKAVEKALPKKVEVLIQSPMGGEITAEAIIAKVGPVEKIYIRVDQNKAYWVNGDDTGSVDLW